MINKENESNKKPEEKKDSGFVDTANIGVYGHIVIKDKDSNKELLNKRG